MPDSRQVTFPAIPGCIQQHRIAGFHFQAALFDLDGTVLDSEPIYKQANRLFLSRHGIQVPADRWAGFVGIGARSFIGIMKTEFGLQGETADLMHEMDGCYLECAAKGVPVFAGTRDFALLCRENGIKIAIASGSTPQAIRQSLAFAGLADLFPVLVSANQVARGKPEPDVFHEAARQLGVEAGHCLVLEDSRYGVQAGLSAGMKVLAFAEGRDINRFSPRPDPDYSRAHFLVEGGGGQFQALPFFDHINAGNAL